MSPAYADGAMPLTGETVPACKRDSILFKRNLNSRLRFLRTPGGREFWDQQRKSYDADFEACVDNWLSTEVHNN
jgi:hypothetical protein